MAERTSHVRSSISRKPLRTHAATQGVPIIDLFHGSELALSWRFFSFNCRSRSVLLDEIFVLPVFLLDKLKYLVIFRAVEPSIVSKVLYKG